MFTDPNDAGVGAGPGEVTVEEVAELLAATEATGNTAPDSKSAAPLQPVGSIPPTLHCASAW